MFPRGRRHTGASFCQRRVLAANPPHFLPAIFLPALAQEIEAILQESLEGQSENAVG
jgi:hypothetical protein